MNKKLLAMGLGVALSMSACAAFAGNNLTLQSVNEPSDITVKCGATQGTEKDTGLPILPGTPRVLSYFLIKIILGTPLVCDFYEASSGIDIATADLTINSNSSATITSYTPYHPNKFSVAISTPVGVAASNINVTLTKN